MLNGVAQQVGNDLADSARIPHAVHVAVRVKCSNTRRGALVRHESITSRQSSSRSTGPRFNGIARPNPLDEKSIRSLINRIIASVFLVIIAIALAVAGSSFLLRDNVRGHADACAAGCAGRG